MLNGLCTLAIPCSILSMVSYARSSNIVELSNLTFLCILLVTTNPSLHRTSNLACSVGTLIISLPILVMLPFFTGMFTTTALILWPSLARSSSSRVVQDVVMDDPVADEIDSRIFVECELRECEG